MSTANKANSSLSLKRVLFVCFLAVAIAPVILLTTWVQQQSYERERERVHDTHLLVASNITNALDRYALDVKAATTTVANIFESGSPLEPVAPLLSRLEFNHLCLLSPDNKVLAKVMAPNNDAPHMWPQGFDDLRARSSSELSFLPIAIASSGEPGIWLTQRYQDGRLLVGVINTDYFIAVQQLVKFGERGHAAIVDQAGSVIAHPKSAWVQEAKSLAAISPVQAMMNGERGVIEFYSPAVKADMVAGYASVPSAGWGVMVPQPLSELQAAAKRHSYIALVIGLAGVLLAACLAWLLSGWVTGPITHLVKSTQSWSGGKKPQFGTHKKILPYELGQLSHAFERMAKRINLTHAELKNQAEKDGLTGLTNRVQIQAALDLAVKNLNPQGATKVGLLYVDLDRFKAINDTLGHAFGDAVLVDVAKRLEAISEDAIVARLGGDEFLLVVQGMVDRQLLFKKAAEVVKSIQEPFWVDDHSVRIDCAVGIAVAPEDADDAEVCLRRADLAMYHAKRDKEERICFYAPFMQEELDRRQKIEQALRLALQNGGLALAYQPRVDLASGHALCVEALLRWPTMQEAESVTIPEIIMVAEQAGLTNQLGRWVLDTVYRETLEVLASDGSPLNVSVNLSAAQFASPKLASYIVDKALEAEFSTERMEVEITETTAMENFEEACRVLDTLSKYGISSSIDDFGTGYSSLSYLKRLPVSFIKIDQSFVRNVEKSTDDQAIVRTILSLSQTLDIPAVAEGVETKAQLEFLASEGCQQVQGYWFAKPMPVAELEDWMAQRGEMLYADGLRESNHLEETSALALNLDNIA